MDIIDKYRREYVRILIRETDNKIMEELTDEIEAEKKKAKKEAANDECSKIRRGFRYKDR